MVINWILEEKKEYRATVDYDGLWKKLIYELFEEFILFFAEDLYEKIDFQRDPEFLQQELFQEIMEDKKGKQVADQIVKVFLKSGEEKWVLIHVEVQGSPDVDFSKRMFRYYYRLFDKFDQDIVAIALLTDGSKQFRPNAFQQGSYGTNLSYEFNMYKFMDFKESVLLEINNPFAIAILAANFANESKNDTEKRYRFKLKLMRLVLRNTDYPPEERRIYLSTLIYFIDYLLQIPKELTRKLRSEIILSKEDTEMMYLDRKNLPPTFGELMEQEKEEGKRLGEELGKELGKEIGIKIGREEGQRLVAQELLKEGMSVEQVAKFAKLPIEEVEKMQVDNSD